MKIGSFTPRAAVRKCARCRSEEHTSELQSQSNLVCRLLLEKKIKTLEEPPSTTHLIRTTANPYALLSTLRPRCQTIRFAPIPALDMPPLSTGSAPMPAADAH